MKAIHSQTVCKGLNLTTAFSFAVVAGLSGNALASEFNPGARAGYAISAIELTSANAPIANGSVGYSITLHAQVGENVCLSEQKAFQVSSQNSDAEAQTEILVAQSRANERACPENYAPAYADLEGYVASEKNYDVVVDTKIPGLGSVSLFGRNGAIVDAFEPVSVRDLGGNSDRVAMAMTARVLKGSNPCQAANTRLAGFGYAFDQELRVSVKAQVVNPNTVCTMEYNPVFETVSFEVAYRPGTVKSIVVQNFAEAGSSKVFPMPTWAP